VAETAQALVSMNDLDLLSNHDVSKDREKGEHCGHCRLPVYDQERHMVDFKPIGEVPDACAAFIGMSYDNNFVSSIDKLLEYVQYRLL